MPNSPLIQSFLLGQSPRSWYCTDESISPVRSVLSCREFLSEKTNPLKMRSGASRDKFRRPGSSKKPRDAAPTINQASRRRKRPWKPVDDFSGDYGDRPGTADSDPVKHARSGLSAPFALIAHKRRSRDRSGVWKSPSWNGKAVLLYGAYVSAPFYPYAPPKRADTQVCPCHVAAEVFL